MIRIMFLNVIMMEEIAVWMIQIPKPLDTAIIANVRILIVQTTAKLANNKNITMRTD